MEIWLIGFALVYCVGVNERENSKSGMESFQGNIYYPIAFGLPATVPGTGVCAALWIGIVVLLNFSNDHV